MNTSFDFGNLLDQMTLALFRVGCAIFIWNYKLYQKAMSWFERRKYIEPFEPSWVNYVTLTYDYSAKKYKNTDEYHVYKGCDHTFIEQHFDDFIRKDNGEKTMDIAERCFMVKHDQGYVCRNWYKGKALSVPEDDHSESTDDSNNTFARSEVEFFFVEYNHPSMPETIELTIPENMYLVGNEILSPCFVLRLLEKQNIEFEFDSRYEITILDHCMKQVKLSMEQYIELEKETYEVKHNEYIQDHTQYVITQEEYESCEETYMLPFYVNVVYFWNDLWKTLGLFWKQTHPINRIVNDIYVESSDSDNESQKAPSPICKSNPISDTESDDESESEEVNSLHTEPQKDPLYIKTNISDSYEILSD